MIPDNAGVPVGGRDQEMPCSTTRTTSTSTISLLRLALTGLALAGTLRTSLQYIGGDGALRMGSVVMVGPISYFPLDTFIMINNT